jgi:hypothetical protein
MEAPPDRFGGTTTDRIVWELERQPHDARMRVVVEVLQRMGMTTPVRPDSLGRAGRLWVVLGTLVLAGGFGVWTWYNAFARSRLDVTTEPADARVFVDGNPVGDSIIVRPGQHTLSVTMPGYTRSDRNVEVGANQTLRLDVELEASPDTGLEITSEPPGMLVWLDGVRVLDPSGPVRTNFRAGRIPPGPHVLELGRTDRGFRTWRREVQIEPGEFTKVHAVVESPIHDR